MSALPDLFGPSSPSLWFVLGLAAICAVDAFLPIVPSEVAVIGAGTLAANGEMALVPVIIAATVGAIVGDHISYLIGRVAPVGRLRRTGRIRRAGDWAAGALHRQGGAVLLAARFIPGGRTATTLTAGAVGYHRWRFGGYTVLAGLMWALYAAGLGAIGAVALPDHPLFGMGVGVALGICLSLVAEAVRRRRGRAAPIRRHPD